MNKATTKPFTDEDIPPYLHEIRDHLLAKFGRLVDGQHPRDDTANSWNFPSSSSVDNPSEEPTSLVRAPSAVLSE